MSELSLRPDNSVVGATIPHESADLHVTGLALYTDDLVNRHPGCLHAYPVQARGLVLDGVVADGIEGQALQGNLERMRKGQAPLGLGPGGGDGGKGKRSDPRRLFGVLHYETCRFVLQPLALLTASGPIHLMTSADGIDHKALLRNLVRG